MLSFFGSKVEEVAPEKEESGMEAILTQAMALIETVALQIEDKVPHTILAALAVAFVVRLVVNLSIWNSLSLLLEYITHPVPDISESIGLEPSEADDDGIESKPGTGSISLVDKKKPGRLQCFDPSTLQLLGDVPAMTTADVNELCAKAKQAQKSWSQTTYAERRVVLRTIQKYIVNHIEEICRVCTRDSGMWVCGSALHQADSFMCVRMLIQVLSPLLLRIDMSNQLTYILSNVLYRQAKG